MQRTQFNFRMRVVWQRYVLRRLWRKQAFSLDTGQFVNWPIRWQDDSVTIIPIRWQYDSSTDNSCCL